MKDGLSEQFEESHDNRVQVYAVIRLDPKAVDPAMAVTIKEILPSREEALLEVERLNRLAKEGDRKYFWQATRFFPQGRGLGPNSPL